MKKSNRLFFKKISLAVVFYVLLFASCREEVSENTNTWATYKADEKGSSYSPLDQINVSNVSQLQPIWTFQADDVPNGEKPAAASQSNQTEMINGFYIQRVIL